MKFETTVTKFIYQEKLIYSIHVYQISDLRTLWPFIVLSQKNGLLSYPKHVGPNFPKIRFIWINSEITLFNPYELKLKTLTDNWYCSWKLQNISIIQTFYNNELFIWLQFSLKFKTVCKCTCLDTVHKIMNKFHRSKYIHVVKLYHSKTKNIVF